jgi:hypothetical protein
MRSRGSPDQSDLPMLTGRRAMKSNNFMFEAIADFYAWQSRNAAFVAKA